MYLHVGNNKIVRQESVIGIFDMDNATLGADTREFLRRAQSEGRLEVSKEEIPKSFILYEKNKNYNKEKREVNKSDTAVCIAQLSTFALIGRMKKKFD